MSQTSDTITRRLSEHIGEHRFTMWFGEASITADGERLEIQAPTRFVADWINHKFNRTIRMVADETLGTTADVHVLVAPQKKTQSHQHDLPRKGALEAPKTRPSPPDRTRGRRPTSGTPERLDPARLDSFVVGDSNRLAWSAACRLSEEDDRSLVSPLFIHGGCGLGKTHLLQGICHRAAERLNDRSSIRYVTGEQFTNEYISAIRNGSVDQFRQAHRHLRLLAIDDVHFLSNKTKTQSEFLHTLDAIELIGARLALASDEHPSDIAKFNKGLVSRFLSGMVVQIDAPDPETRLALVQQLAKRRSLHLTDGAAQLLADHCPGSVRELLGALTRLEAMQILDPEHLPHVDSSQMLIPGFDEFGRRRIGSMTIQRLVEHRALDRKVHVSIPMIVDATCQRLGVTGEELTGRSRHRRISLARAVIAYLARELTTLSYPEIARAMGRNNHSSVHAGARRLARSIDSEPRIVLDGHKGGGDTIDLVQLLDGLRRTIRG